jgi:hypothetical protein
MLAKRTQELSFQDIQSLVDDQVPESRHLDYKEERPAAQSAPETKQADFLVDVTAFANGSGGTLVYGVRERKTADGKQTGVPDAILGLRNFVADTEENRLRGLMRAKIEPQLPVGSVEFRALPLPSEPDKQVLVVHVARTWAGPHFVVAGGRHKYQCYVRDGNGNQPLDVQGIREAVMGAAGIGEKLEAFRLSRCGTIAGGNLPAIMGFTAKLILHLVPLASLDGQARVDPLRARTLAEKNNAIPLYANGWADCTRRPNVDGLLIAAATGDRKTYSCMQLFRSGVLEDVDSANLEIDSAGGSISTVVIERELLSHTPRYLSLLKDLGLTGPIALSLSLQGVMGRFHREAKTKMAERTNSLPRFDRADVLLPTLLLEGDDLDKPPTEMLEPLLHSLWQAGGVDHCHRYEQGKYDPKRELDLFG